MTITVDDMKGKLLTIDQLQVELAKSEPIDSHHVDGTSGVKFDFRSDWYEDMSVKQDDAPIDVFMTVAGVERQMTRGAFESAAKQHGLGKPYIKRLPDHLIKNLMEYHYSSSGLGENEYSMLTVNDRVAAFTRPSHVPYSNLSLLEAGTTGIRAQYGADVEILADYKRSNTLARTDFRLIVPETERGIAGTGMDDIPENQDDLWSSGVHIFNSVLGDKPTTIESYLFRWWCTNGATEQASAVGKWDRRKAGGEDVYTWAENAVNEVLGGMEDRFHQLSSLTRVDVSGNVASVLRELFTMYSIPLTQRERVSDIILGSTVLTMYTVMQAITLAANEQDDPAMSDRLMRVGGSIPHATFDPEKARIWREGHIAGHESSNPYEIVIPN